MGTTPRTLLQAIAPLCGDGGLGTPNVPYGVLSVAVILDEMDDIPEKTGENIKGDKE